MCNINTYGINQNLQGPYYIKHYAELELKIFE